MEPSRPRPETLRRSDRLRETAAYQRCYREGRRRGGRILLLYARLGGEATRFGQTASRKVGGAVLRHRLKRWGREVFRRFPDRASLPAGDLVVHFKPEAARACFSDVARELGQQLEILVFREQR